MGIQLLSVGKQSQDSQAPRRTRRLRRILTSPETTIFLVSLWISVVCNLGYWKVLAGNNPGATEPNYGMLASFFALTIGLIAIALLVLASGFATRFALSMALIVAATAGYFTTNYGTLFDSTMIQNVVETNQSEALELITRPMLVFVIAAGLIPALLVWRNKMTKRRLSQAILYRGIAIVIALSFIAAPLYANQKEVFSVARNHHELRHMIAPLNVLLGSASFVKQSLRKPVPFRHIALDATHSRSDATHRKPAVNVLIIGETARAANFSLGEYDRNTNPSLGQRSDIFFRTITSCGTATAASLPCMFSHQGHANFDGQESSNQDNLLDIAVRSGYDVLWIDNGNNCKGVCSRVHHLDVHKLTSVTACPSGECYDEVLVEELEKVIANVSSDTFIVLHQLGSHGPAYFKRYPENYRKFVPDCRSADFVNCKRHEIVNAYDNTIAYTDYLIASAIDVLSENSATIDASLIYVSDHGESLGEHNMYLHGLPYSLAPAEQTEVPFVAWLGDGYRESRGISPSCDLPSNAGGISHDNLFHTELGLLGIKTALYQQDMDLLTSCRSNPIVSSNENPKPGPTMGST